jgi:hypothetical protein
MSKQEFPNEVKEVDEKALQNAAPTKSKPWWKLGGIDYSFVSVNAGYVKTADIKTAESASSSDSKLGEAEKLGHNVWETDDSKEIYKPIDGYEGAHRFDPAFSWELEEEKRLVRTVSLNISPLCSSTADKAPARLAYCPTSLHYVFRSATRSRKHYSSSFR